jgi:hypothetical protein
VGKGRLIAIPGNPTNSALGEDLNQFLQKKLKKYDPHPGSPQQSKPSSDTGTADNTDDDTMHQT